MLLAVLVFEKRRNNVITYKKNRIQGYEMQQCVRDLIDVHMFIDFEET